MKFRVGYELQYDFPKPTPVILLLNIHFTRVSDLAVLDHIGPSTLQSLRVWTDEIAGSASMRCR